MIFATCNKKIFAKKSPKDFEIFSKHLVMARGVYGWQENFLRCFLDTGGPDIDISVFASITRPAYKSLSEE